MKLLDTINIVAVVLTRVKTFKDTKDVEFTCTFEAQNPNNKNIALIIPMPPRHLKSEFMFLLYHPNWMMGEPQYFELASSMTLWENTLKAYGRPIHPKRSKTHIKYNYSTYNHIMGWIREHDREIPHNTTAII